MFTALLALTRWKEHVLFVLITTLLGAHAAAWPLNSKLLLVLTANILAVAFAFMWNDVEDAPDDSRSPAKRGRNPVSSGALRRPAAVVASIAVAATAAGLFALVNSIVFAIGLATLITAFLYSWRAIRLKRIPVIDVVSHALMLAAFQFLCAYFAMSPTGIPPLGPLLFVSAFSAYGQLFNQLRDRDADLAVGLRHSAARLGPRRAHYVMAACAAVAIVSALSAIRDGFVPAWVPACAGFFTAIAVTRPLMQLRSAVVLDTEVLHTPVLCAVALALTLWTVVSPWSL